MKSLLPIAAVAVASLGGCDRTREYCTDAQQLGRWTLTASLFEQNSGYPGVCPSLPAAVTVTSGSARACVADSATACSFGFGYIAPIGDAPDECFGGLALMFGDGSKLECDQVEPDSDSTASGVCIWCDHVHPPDGFGSDCSEDCRYTLRLARP